MFTRNDEKAKSMKQFIKIILFHIIGLFSALSYANSITGCQKAIEYFANEDRVCTKFDLFDEKDFLHLKESCEIAVKKHSENSNYLVALAKIQTRLGDMSEAKGNLEKASSQGNKKAKVILIVGDLFSFIQQEDLENAKKQAYLLQDLAKSRNIEALRAVSLLFGKKENKLLKYSKSDIISWIKSEAKKGDRLLQSSLANIYGGNLDTQWQSTYWSVKSAEQGNCMAGSDIESRLEDLENSNVPKKIKLELQKFVSSAEVGNANAQNILANYYDFNMNIEESIKWRKLAAENGNRYSQYWLGLLYTSGSGVEKNFQKARYWLNKATQQGSKSAKRDLADFEQKIKGTK